MKDVIGKILNHPIATILVIGATANGIANIISAAKGKGTAPVVYLNVDKPEKKTT